MPSLLLTGAWAVPEPTVLPVLQRQKTTYSMYPKAEPAPVTSSAPPVSTLYSLPVVCSWEPLNVIQVHTGLVLVLSLPCLCQAESLL